MTYIPDKVVSILPPAILGEAGRKHVIYGMCQSDSGFYHVPDDFTYEDARSRWVQWTPPPKIKAESKTWNVESSKKGSFYNVKNDGNYWSCSCPSNIYHRNKDCRHIKQIKEKTGWKP
jgi:hypothetical protein